jgi:hypothetical protein
MKSSLAKTNNVLEDMDLSAENMDLEVSQSFSPQLSEGRSCITHTARKEGQQTEGDTYSFSVDDTFIDYIKM